MNKKCYLVLCPRICREMNAIQHSVHFRAFLHPLSSGNAFADTESHALEIIAKVQGSVEAAYGG